MGGARPEETIPCVFYSTSGVSRANWGGFQVYFESVEHRRSLLRAITMRVGKLLLDLGSLTSNDASFDTEPQSVRHSFPYLHLNVFKLPN